MAKIELASSDADGALMMRRSNKTGDAKWADIEDLINRWARRDPRGAVWLESAIKSTQEGLFDKRHGLLMGKSKGEVNYTSTRIGIMLHPDLLAYITAFYPDFLSTKDDLREFKKRFPKFRITEKI